MVQYSAVQYSTIRVGVSERVGGWMDGWMGGIRVIGLVYDYSKERTVHYSTCTAVAVYIYYI